MDNRKADVLTKGSVHQPQIAAPLFTLSLNAFDHRVGR